MSTVCYEVDKESKAMLMEMFPPKYPAVRYDHITVEIGDMDAKKPDAPDLVQVIGVANDGNGLEALVVSVDNTLVRPKDGKIWHITASFDPNKLAPAEFDVFSFPDKMMEKPYKPVTSNGLLCQLFNEDGTIKEPSNPHWKLELLDKPIEIKVHPQVQYNAFELQMFQSQGKKL